MRRSYPTIEQQFWTYVTKGSEDECWLWQGSVGEAGYGQLTFRNQHYAVHRLAYQLQVGPIIHRDVCHTCDTRRCVNPKHLFNASHSVNMQDAVAKGRIKFNKLILGNIERGKAIREEQAAARARREARRIGSAEGVAWADDNGKARDSMGRFSDGRTIYEQTKRDQFGRFNAGRDLPPPKRNEHGHFTK